MSKHILFTATILFLIGGTSFAQNKGKGPGAKNDVTFLEDISITPAAQQSSDPKAVFAEPVFKTSKPVTTPASAVSVEQASSLQFKYALLLDTEVEEMQNIALLQVIDEWYGTRYRLGGTTKDGVDCSSLMQTFFASLYSLTLPRTAREQYNASRRISRAELREGDLVFFNTVGGISHVGMYLQNNKFVHASSGGVTVSDLFDEYWMKKFIGAGRMENLALASTAKP